MIRRHRLRFPLLGAAVLFCVASTVRTEEIFVTAPSDVIVAVDFETGQSRTAVRDEGTHFQGLTAWGAGNGLRLVAANTTRGGDIRLYDPETGDGVRLARFREAHGVAVNFEGEVFAVNRSKSKDDVVLFIPRRGGCPASVSGPFPPGCGPGGYEEATSIDAAVAVGGKKTKELADVRLLRSSVPGLARTGQLLVLVKSPPMVLAYTEPASGWADCDGSCDPEKIADLPGYTPTGFDATGDALLVTTEQGAVLEVTSGGAQPLVHLGGKGAKIAVGAMGDQQVAYATVSNKGGKLYRFFTDGSDLQSVRAQVPEGVTTESTRVVALGAGGDVAILLPTMNATFDQVNAGGLIDSNCALYPRPDGPGPFTLGDLGITEDADVVIPDYVVPFRIGDPASGPLAYFLCRVDTSAFFRRTVEIHENERRFLGYDPDCNSDNSATGVTKQARFFWAPAEGETNSEGAMFIDISAGCGSNVGRGMKFSWIMPAASDARSVCEILDFKLDGLEGTLDLFAGDGAVAGACIGDAGDPGPVPATAFSRVGDPADWAYLATTEGTFGETGNDFLEGGGTATFVYKDAAWSHRFGITDATGDVAVIANSASPGSPTEFTASGPFTFFFENLSGNTGRAQSDGTESGSARMAVYRNLHDPGLFAFFYDDGGGDPDVDYNDFIVTVKGEPGTLCALRTAVAAGKEALGDAASCPGGSDLSGVLNAFTSVTEIVEERVDDFDDTDQNRSGEIQARAESGTFMTCKLTDCPSTTSGGQSHP